MGTVRKPVLIAIALTLVGALGWLALDAFDAPPTVEWVIAPNDPLARIEAMPDQLDGSRPDGTWRDPDRAPSGAREPAAEPLDQTVELTGRVVDEGGAPIAEAEVFLTLRQIRRSASARRIADPVRTDDRGRFRFRGPAYRSLSIVLETFHPRFAPTVELRALDGSEAHIQLADVVLRPGGTVEGRIRDEFGAALANATVTLEPSRTNPMLWGRRTELLRPEVTTDGTGGFAFAGVARGGFRIRAELEGFEKAASAPFEMATTGIHRVDDLVLVRGAVLTGEIRDTRGNAIRDARVQVRSTTGRGNFRTTSDSDGRFALEHLPRGELALGVSARGFLGHEEVIDTAAVTAAADIEIELEDGLRITGLVHGPDGTPVEMFAARPRRLGALDAPDRGLEPETRTPEAGPPRAGLPSGRPQGPGQKAGRSPFPADAGTPVRHPEGAFEFEGMLDGRYVVDITGSAYQAVRTEEFELRRDQPAPHIVVHLPRGVRIHGSVLTAEGEPAAGAALELRQAADAPEREGPRGPQGSGRILWAADRITTDDRGRYAFENARPGRYELSARFDGYAETTSPPLDANGDTRYDLRLEAFGAIEGKVIAVADLSDTRVIAVNTQPGSALSRSSRVSTPVQPDGTYRLDQVAPGTYRVAVTLGSARSLLAIADDDPAKLVTVHPGRTTQHNPVFEAPPAGAIVGTVYGDRVPQDLQIRAVAESAPQGNVLGGTVGRIRAGRIDTNGDFRIERVPEGRHTLRIATGRNRMLLYETEIFVARDQEVRVDATLVLVDLEGRIESADGSAPSGHAVFYRGVDSPPDGSGPRPQQYRAGVSQGRFRADDMPRDRYCVVFSTGGQTSHVVVSATELDRPIVIPFPAR